MVQGIHDCIHIFYQFLAKYIYSWAHNHMNTSIVSISIAKYELFHNIHQLRNPSNKERHCFSDVFSTKQTSDPDVNVSMTYCFIFQVSITQY